MELAKAINASGMLLRRYFYLSMFPAEEDDFLPALTPPQVEMIIAIHSQGSTTVKQLAQLLCVKAPSVSTRVERLVEMGILTREENPADRREVLVRISPKESVLIEELQKRKLQAGLELVERIGPEHAQKWHDVCVRIGQVLDGAGCRQKKQCSPDADVPRAPGKSSIRQAG